MGRSQAIDAHRAVDCALQSFLIVYPPVRSICRIEHETEDLSVARKHTGNQEG